MAVVGKSQPSSILNIIAETPKTNKEEAETVSLTFVGELPEFAPEQHPMKGSVFFNPANESQIIVRDFYYPQPGPDAFFWAGESLPACSTESINSTNYLLDTDRVGTTDYSDESQPILPAYDGTQGDLSLTLPPGAKTKSVIQINKLSI